MLLRITNMRGVNLNVFEFDYDLTWAAFFMNADETIYGRFGGRDGAEADKYLTLSGLKSAMRAAIAAHRRYVPPDPAPADKPPQTVDQLHAAKRLRADACIHCHQVYDFGREEKIAAGHWSRDAVWVYPSPQSLGITLGPAQGNRIATVSHQSPAERAGLRVGDEVRTIDSRSVASFADVQYALHRAPAAGSLTVTWQREGQSLSGKLDLAAGWRQSDISWRASMWGLEPGPNVYGPDLSPEERKALGLSAKALAFRQEQYVPLPAKKAGIEADDIILGIEGKNLDMTMLQFNAFVRLNYKVGDQIKLNVLRKGERIEVPMTLTGRQGKP